MEKVMRLKEVERAAKEAVAIMRQRITEAVRYAEAYEGGDRTIVLDGSMLSPSTRALPGAERVYQAAYEQYGLWEAFEAIADRIEDFTVPDGRTDSESPDDWYVGWEDGCLFAFAPEYGAEQ